MLLRLITRLVLLLVLGVLASGVVSARIQDRVWPPAASAEKLASWGCDPETAVLRQAAAMQAAETQQAASSLGYETASVLSLAPENVINARSWQDYEKAIQSLYGNTPFSQRTYRVMVDGKYVNGVADNVAVMGGRSVAIEAKFVTGSWESSIRNPWSGIGRTPFSKAERWKMVNQAKKYSAAFDEVIYHTNDPKLMKHYQEVFRRFGLDNVTIKHTP